MENPAESLLSTLPPRQRLALAYATARSRPAILALMAFDSRMAAIVRQSREPILAQIRLAWWRDRLIAEPEHWSQAEPLLSCLGDWSGGMQVLINLIDAWEAMSGEAALPAAVFSALARARAESFAALSVGPAHVAMRLAHNWALVDIARHLAHPGERQIVIDLARARDWHPAKLECGLRPLAIMHALAARDLRDGVPVGRSPARDLVIAMRIGWWGR